VDLDVVRRNLTHRVREFRALEKPARVTPESCEALCNVSVHERQLGICLLLAEFDWVGFRSALARSAEARVELLACTRGSGTQFGRFNCQGKSGPLFDAIAASRLDLARRIAQLSDAPYARDYEYEDDRAFAMFVQAWIAADFRPHAEHQRLLDRFEEVCEGQGGARHAIGEALLTQSAPMFAASLLELSDEFAAAYEEEAEGPVFDQFRFRTEQYVCVEGIALRALGAALGMEVDAVIRFMPDEND
jgi:hypothetical protein